MLVPLYIFMLKMGASPIAPLATNPLTVTLRTEKDLDITLGTRHDLNITLLAEKDLELILQPGVD
jgi:hypothetical protein